MTEHSHDVRIAIALLSQSVEQLKKDADQMQKDLDELKAKALRISGGVAITIVLGSIAGWAVSVMDKLRWK